ncbi:universal stress protein [Opitutus sp. GAS368]|uniref:universal stress protein n=1 Tax=Opitutus sp. GAS368 TaxID=1882749 RepID=UPI00087BCF10|nr:universal stress protein [Opitutus sp. GAS368]SDR75737.1 Nucleotide-binding universal stress protein, UspA family [Opitutus sp. GAS368]
MKAILVPVDFSAATTRVCDAACALAKITKARLVLLHVIEPPPVLLGDAYAFDAGALAAAVTAGEKYATRRLRALGRRCSGGQQAVQTVQITGRTVATILAKAASTKAAYIVLGSHGHGLAYDLLVGSTAQGVLRKARCSVLVVPMGRR